MYVCLCVSVYVCVRVRVCACFAHVRMCVYACEHVRACVCLCVCVVPMHELQTCRAWIENLQQLVHPVLQALHLCKRGMSGQK